MSIVTLVDTRLRHTVSISWNHNRILSLSLMCTWLVVCVTVAYLFVYLSESAYRFVWLAPISLTVVSLAGLWNPFRNMVISSYWITALSMLADMPYLLVLAALVFFGGLTLWYCYIQKDSDASLQGAVEKT